MTSLFLRDEILPYLLTLSCAFSFIYCPQVCWNRRRKTNTCTLSLPPTPGPSFPFTVSSTYTLVQWTKNQPCLSTIISSFQILQTCSCATTTFTTQPYTAHGCFLDVLKVLHPPRADVTSFGVITCLRAPFPHLCPPLPQGPSGVCLG